MCGQEEVNLRVTMRKTTPRIPVVLNMQEVVKILDHLEERNRLLAEVQYGSGLRLAELMELRIKDILGLPRPRSVPRPRLRNCAATSRASGGVQPRPAAGRPQGRNRQAIHQPRIAALFCHSSPGGRKRHQDHPGAASVLLANFAP